MVENSPSPLSHRLGWLILIWLTSVAGLGIVAGILRWWLHP